MLKFNDARNHGELFPSAIFHVERGCVLQSIMETNFSYTGAQICKYLALELKGHTTFGNYRQLFLTKYDLIKQKHTD